MIGNPVIDSMMNRKSVRKCKETKPDREVIETVVRAGQQAPFASQLYSVVFSTKGKIAFKAPIWFVICVDAHKLELFMRKRGWNIVTNDLTILLLGMQDAAYMAQNMVTAAESLGLGSGYLEQEHYKRNKAKIAKEDGSKDAFTFKNYSWTEHISRKWGQWVASPSELIDALKERGFDLERD